MEFVYAPLGLLLWFRGVSNYLGSQMFELKATNNCGEEINMLDGDSKRSAPWSDIIECIDYISLATECLAS